jgi:hypothetical protein
MNPPLGGQGGKPEEQGGKSIRAGVMGVYNYCVLLNRKASNKLIFHIFKFIE